MQEMKLARPAIAIVRPIIYWITTGLIVLETAVGAEWDLARIRFVRDIFDHLGYPYYLLTLLGIWKLPAAIVLVIPGFQRVKEWAYAGLFLVYTGAVASHFLVGDSKDAWSPLLLAILTLISWALRPDSRKLSAGHSGAGGEAHRGAHSHTTAPVATRSRLRGIGYWVITGLLAFCMIPGGVVQLLGAKENVEGIVNLGYPVFFTGILGFWKILGGVTILIPRFGVAKEWAYAGIVFDLSGAAVSNAVAGMPAWHIVVNIVLIILTVLSWAWRPASRTISAS
jgi:uncharacterized membrane protein YphA (DoxX/SURF4 family)